MCLRFTRSLATSLGECNTFKCARNSTLECGCTVTCNTAVICPDAGTAVLVIRLPFCTFSRLKPIFITDLHQCARVYETLQKLWNALSKRTIGIDICHILHKK